jgi:hypothetical protein
MAAPGIHEVEQNIEVTGLTAVLLQSQPFGANELLLDADQPTSGGIPAAPRLTKGEKQRRIRKNLERG